MSGDTYYNASVAQKYDKLRSWEYSIPKGLVQIAKIDKSARVLDLGCGTGNLIAAIRDISLCACVGVDLSYEMLCIARDKIPEAIFLQSTLAEMSFSQAVFDCVVGSFFLHQLPANQHPRVIDECYRLLRNGYLIIITLSHPQIEDGVYGRFFPEVIDIDQVRFPPIHQICQWFQVSGLVEVRSETVMDRPIQIDENFLFNVENKPISTLDMISKESFLQGMAKLRGYVKSNKGARTIYQRPLTVVYGKKV